MAVLYCSLGLLITPAWNCFVTFRLEFVYITYLNISDIPEIKVKYKCITVAFLWPRLLSGQKVAAYVLPLGQRGMCVKLPLSLSPLSPSVAPTFWFFGSFVLGGMIRRRHLRTVNRLCGLDALWCPTHVHIQSCCLSLLSICGCVVDSHFVWSVWLHYFERIMDCYYFSFWESWNPGEPGPFCGDRRISGLGPEERSARQVLNLVLAWWTCCRNYCWNWWIVDTVESVCLGLNHVRRKSSQNTLAEVSLASLAGPHRMGKLHCCTHTPTPCLLQRCMWRVGRLECLVKAWLVREELQNASNWLHR